MDFQSPHPTSLGKPRVNPIAWSVYFAALEIMQNTIKQVKFNEHVKTVYFFLSKKTKFTLLIFRYLTQNLFQTVFVYVNGYTSNNEWHLRNLPFWLLSWATIHSLGDSSHPMGHACGKPQFHLEYYFNKVSKTLFIRSQVCKLADNCMVLVYKYQLNNQWGVIEKCYGLPPPPPPIYVMDCSKAGKYLL